MHYSNHISELKKRKRLIESIDKTEVHIFIQLIKDLFIKLYKFKDLKTNKRSTLVFRHFFLLKYSAFMTKMRIQKNSMNLRHVYFYVQEGNVFIYSPKAFYKTCEIYVFTLDVFL